jgi:hypothetical protein
MAEPTENTFTAYLGPEFQQRLMWQLLVEPEFAEKTLPNLAIDYFDDPYLKRLFIIILEYFREYGKVPNLQNQSIQQAINQFKTPNNKIEEESLFSVIERVVLWNERVLNKEMLHDGEAVRKSTNSFIIQQEYRKLGEFILEKTKNGDIKSKHTLGAIEEKIQKIGHIGDDEDYGTEITENISKALRKEFRKTIPTGISVIDSLTGGGLGKGEIGLILTPSGVGKTTALTKIANTAYELEYNVLQIVFEDTVEQIQRKHYTIWTKYPLSQIDDNNETVDKLVHKKIEESKNRGHLVIKKFSQENTTMMDIRNWIVRYQKKWGYTFDMVIIDYLDCLESHKKSPDRNEAELQIIKSFEAMAADFNIPAWTAIQSNRSGFDSEFVEAHQTGGSIKRIQKAHFFMSVAKTPDQKEASLANIRIIKARFAQDGQTFKDCTFNNDSMEIIVQDSKYANVKPFRGLRKYDTVDVDKLEEHAEETKHDVEEKPSTNIIIHTHISQYAEKAIEKANGDGVNEGVSEGVNDGVKKITDYSSNEINDLLKRNAELLVDNNPETTIKHIEEIKTAIDKDIVNRVMSDDKLLEIDGTATNTPTVEMPVVEEYTEIIDDVIGWSGESYVVNVNETEVKIETIQPEKEDTVINKNELNELYSPPKSEEKQDIPPKIGSLSVDYAKNDDVIFTDPDAPTGACLQVYDVLNKMEKEQGIIKKE